MSCLGLCLDGQGVLRGTYAVPHQSPCVADNLITLEDLLFASSESRTWGPLTDEDRYILVITLVSSFLQLHSTPWFRDSWSYRDISFLETSNGSGHTVDVRRPVVMTTHQRDTGTSSVASTTIYTDGSSNSHDDNVNLLALARLLLEIRFNDRIELLQRQGDLGPDTLPNEATDLRTLKRWVVKEKGNLSFAFRDAITFFMKCFADPSADLQDITFRQSIVDKVVVPLLEELHYWQEGLS